MRIRFVSITWLAALLVWNALASFAQEVATLRFTSPATVKAWQPSHDISAMEPSSAGLVIHISGDDPYTFGPRIDFPAQPLWMTLRLRSDEGGMAQLFYFGGGGPTEANSIRFHVKGGEWFQARVPLPALGPNTGLRFDPPGERGICVIESMVFSVRPRLEPPEWLSPETNVLVGGISEIVTGSIRLRYGANRFGRFVLDVGGETFAMGNSRSQLGYVIDGGPRWMVLTNRIELDRQAGGLVARLRAADADGAHWKIEQSFKCSAPPSAIDVETSIETDRDREVIYAPFLTLFCGPGTFGTNKTQAILAGVEYLENEPSSSEADAIGEQAKRLAPDSYKITFPLMAISGQGRYLGLIWRPSDAVAAVYDSPDRVFHSGGHLMQLVLPGAAPGAREPGRLLPYEGLHLKAGMPVRASAIIVGGLGDTVVPAVQEYLARLGLPPLPKPAYDAQAYFRLAAGGWLNSKIRDGALFRHAVGGNFHAGPAADAVIGMDWLKDRVGDTALSNRLADVSEQARQKLSPESYNNAQIGHTRTMLPALVLGGVMENAETAAAQGRAILAGFNPDGTIGYVAPSAAHDLGRTHWARHANGLTAARLMTLLQDAAFSGDTNLIGESVRLARSLSQYRNTVPRGAQTWEVPLHTPDILASAYLVQCHLIAYEMSGDAHFLDEAKYWAWTGVPFVYLSPPAGGPVGVYATTPVLGATEYVAPMWIGLPVQWCGLVYADAIRRLSRYDKSGPWRQLADGIAASGIQQTHPPEDTARQGLLPDSFNLLAQFRNPVPINPATLFPEAIQYYGEAPLYDFRGLPLAGLRVIAPGRVDLVSEREDAAEFAVSAWPNHPCFVMINGFRARPRIWINGAETDLSPPHLYQAETGRLALSISSKAEIKLQWP